MSVQENRNIQKDSNVVLEIPPETVLAYSIIELSIKTDGQYSKSVLLLMGDGPYFQSVSSFL